MNLSDHFTLEELTFSQTAIRKGIDNTPSNEVRSNLVRLSEFLETVRRRVGLPIHITSGYRSPELNNAIGGASNSQHCLGCAADITVRGISLDEIIKRIGDLDFDQLIREYDSWIHISIPPIGKSPRKQKLIIDHNGTRPYGV